MTQQKPLLIISFFFSFFSLSLFWRVPVESMVALVHRGAVLQRYAVIATRHQHGARLARRQSASFAAAPKSSADSPTSSSADSPTSSASASTLTKGPPGPHVHEVNKSKFVATAFGGVRSAAEALALIKAASARDASHNCFAFVVRRGLSERCSDDGEPAGTAGRPILGAISGEGLENVAVLVSRWRSGPKLGPGGLSRAYGAAARDCLRGAVGRGCLVRFEESCVVEVVVAVDAVGAAYSALSACGGAEGIQEEYGSGSGSGSGDDGSSSSSSPSSLASGLVRLRATIPVSAVPAVAAAVAGASAGKGVVSVVESEEEY